MKSYAILGLLAALAATACTGGEAPPEGGESAQPTVPPGLSGMAAPSAQGIPTVVEVTGGGVAAPDPTMVSPVIDQLGLDFIPRRIFVPVGDTIVFTNSETVTHNVRIVRISDGQQMIDEEADPGEIASFVVDQTGGYEVLCDHHAGMRAFFYGTTTPYAAFAEPDGSYHLPDVPAGSYTVSTWSVDPDGRVERTVEVAATGTQTDLLP